MSVYRQAGPSRPWLLAAVGAAALLVGGVAGFLVRGDGGGEPTLRASVADLRDRMGPAVQGLEVLPIEYGDAVGGAPTELEGARGHLTRTRDAFAAARADLALLAPAETARLGRELDALAALVDRRGPAKAVEEAAGRAAATLRAALREPAG
ncbi:MAG TPA: hypothetical protein VF520_12265 [Thermoleophilaceae bacterium]|jgi:hypothetical protein